MPDLGAVGICTMSTNALAISICPISGQNPAYFRDWRGYNNLIQGTVTDSVGNPFAYAIVRAYDRKTGQFVGQTTTDSTGVYKLYSQTHEELDVICVDLAASPDYNDLIFRVIPA